MQAYQKNVIGGDVALETLEPIHRSKKRGR